MWIITGRFTNKRQRDFIGTESIAPGSPDHMI